ncbi:MAG: hypothetical protein KHX53_03330 [Bacteroides sp.]|nr:hypothetical protein [Bacteroides sp.]
MKKLIIKSAFVAAFIAVAGYTVYNSQKEEMDLSEFALDNVEALAYTESSDEFTQSTCCVATWENLSCYGCNGLTYSYAVRQQ